MNAVRRTAAALAAAKAVIGSVTVGTAVIGSAVVGSAAPALAATPSPSPSVAIPAGLYGTADPTYDGVWRQSLALIAQDAVGVVPADKAVTWLAGQQCANGAFGAFRADAGKPCAADTNSTAVAVQALAALGGHDTATDNALAWLKSVQNKDGGWGYTAGGPSDANSTSVVIGAFATAGTKPQDIRKGAGSGSSGKSPYDALLALALPCTGADAGAFAYQPDKKGALTANADATAAAVLGALGEPITGSGTEGTARTETPSACAKTADPERAALNGAGYLAKALAKDGHLTSALPGADDQPDYGNTADAVVALTSAGLADQAKPAVRWLEANSAKWAAQAGPAAYAQLILAATDAGADPRDFGGQNLVDQLGATGPTPKKTSDAQATDTATPATKSADGDDGTPKAVWAIGGGLLIGALIGATLMFRGRRRQQP
ncbi:prenyltransferase/squalene oxidase repeat-containing protein [Streptomyces sp. NPDC088794]|uniref:prenyltransferase/squalene oxidase repeat-containing protein n=1 Tax=Streptomyces sp. NPDC088794 TaxID=3365902 RepID=UPI003828EC3C